MAYKTCFLFLALMLAVLLLDTRTANACSCADQQTILAEYEWANVIVIAEVRSVEKSAKGYGYDGISSTKMLVERVFKGSLKIGDEMTFAQGGGADCIWTFQEKDIGKRFLFYLYEREKNQTVWIAGTCGRSRRLERAADDLLYLENIDKVRGKTRLSGTLSYSQAPVLEGEEWISRPLDGRKVRIIGQKKTYELVTDANGVYEIYDLPAGTYTVEPEAFDGWKIDYPYSSKRPEELRAGKGNIDKTTKREFQVVVETGKHAYFNFTYGINNIIRGKVFDVAGNGMKDVCLSLVPAQGKVAKYFREFDCTDKDGAFEMTGIPPGGYLMVVNDDGKISSSEPFPTFYYPNVFEREKAGVINIGAGDVREDTNIYIPKMEETISVEGTLLYADGKPVSEGWVEFKADNANASTEGESRAKTDANGQFSIRILKGLQGKLYGEMFTYVGRFENCPKLDELIRKTGRDMAEIKTAVIEIRAGDNLSKIELKYAFPFCRKAKQRQSND